MKPPKKEVKKPYVFEYKGAPSFTVQIPGEFVKQKPKQLFLARAQNSIFSISRAKLEEKAGLNQAAEGYVAALKKLGSGVALKKMSIIKLPRTDIQYPWASTPGPGNCRIERFCIPSNLNKNISTRSQAGAWEPEEQAG
ncbi:MAG: hypothetical protein JRG97_17175 [Deltaproteobacteria bacterium]|nr:hypothetical protein [Deltaproteobacteria bacterium]